MPLREFPAARQADPRGATGYDRNFVLKIHDDGFSFFSRGRQPRAGQPSLPLYASNILSFPPLESSGSATEKAAG
jgi:hypothetical protein